MAAHGATQADFALSNGQIEVESSSVDGTAEIGGKTNVQLTLKNVGTAPASYDLAERSPADPRPIAESADQRSIHRSFQPLMLELLRHIEEREQRESDSAELQETTHVFRKEST